MGTSASAAAGGGAEDPGAALADGSADGVADSPGPWVRVGVGPAGRRLAAAAPPDDGVGLDVPEPPDPTPKPRMDTATASTTRPTTMTTGKRFIRGSLPEEPATG